MSENPARKVRKNFGGLIDWEVLDSSVYLSFCCAKFFLCLLRDGCVC